MHSSEWNLLNKKAASDCWVHISSTATFGDPKESFRLSSSSNQRIPRQELLLGGRGSIDVLEDQVERAGVAVGLQAGGLGQGQQGGTGRQEQEQKGKGGEQRPAEQGGSSAELLGLAGDTVGCWEPGVRVGEGRGSTHQSRRE